MSLPKGNDRFNAEAAAWDANPDVHRASDGALQALLAAYTEPKLAKFDVLEIGCGTGLLTLRLAPYVRSIVAVDAAAGMIEALEAKLEEAAANNNNNSKVIRPLCAMLEDAGDARLRGQRFDLVVSHLTLHHVADLKGLVGGVMFGCLRSGEGGGEVALTDFEDTGEEARRFHPEGKMDGVEWPRGVGRAQMEGLLREVGFVDVCVEEAFRMDKEVERVPGEWGGFGLEKRPAEGEAAVGVFPFLLCRGRRP